MSRPGATGELSCDAQHFLCAVVPDFPNRLLEPRESPWHQCDTRPRIAFLARGPAMNYSQMKDERLLAFYEHVRQQVALDAGSHYRFAGDGVRAYADNLREEMDKRWLKFTPIDWSTDR
jgi:hypothetical protein